MDDLRKATPKTLKQAIENGLTDARTIAGTSLWSPPEVHEIIEAHVLDFLRQHVGALYLEFDDTLDIRALNRVRAMARRIGVER